MHKIIEFPKVQDPRGNLTFLQAPNQIPFPISRVFWTYDVPSGEVRGGHAYYKQEEVIVALSGSFDVVLINIDGSTVTVSLNRSNYGLYLPPKTWRHMQNFSTNSLSLHISSRAFDSDDYIRDLDHFRTLNL